MKRKWLCRVLLGGRTYNPIPPCILLLVDYYFPFYTTIVVIPSPYYIDRNIIENKTPFLCFANGVECQTTKKQI